MPGWLHFLAKCFIFSPHSLSLDVIPRIPHTYIILYRAIYLIPVYICITGATYIHTRNKAGDDRLQRTDQGKQASSAFTATAPTSGLSSAPSHATSTQTPQCWPAGGRGGERNDACHNYQEEVGQRRRERGSLWPRVPVIISSHTRNSCWRGNKGYSILSVSPPTPHH